jgi:cytochrome c oxidase subunit 4
MSAEAHSHVPAHPAPAHAAPAHDEHEHHGPSVKMYFAIFAALCVLTVVTVQSAKIDFTAMVGDHAMGELLSNIVALGIAFTKASLVVLFFMHVKYENRLVGLAVVSSVIWLCFLLFITASDYMTRSSDWHLFAPAEASAPATPASH